MSIRHDVITACFAAWNLRDRDAYCACLTDDVRYDVPAAVPFAGRLTGREEVGAFAERMWEFFPELETVVEKVHGHENSAVVRGVHQGRTPDGAEHRVPFLTAMELRDGKICDVRQQLDAGLVMRAVAGQAAEPPRAPVAR